MRTTLPSLLAALVLLVPLRTLAQDEAPSAPAPSAPAAAADAATALLDELSIGHNPADDASALRSVKTLAASLPLRSPDTAPYELTPLRQTFRGFQPATLDCSEEIDASRALSDLLPLVILADSTTSGAAERLAALFQHSIRSALVLGTPTAGDPLLSDAFPCPPEIMPDTQVILPAATLTFPDGFVLRPDAPLDPDVLITQAALSEPLYEPDENSITFRSRKKGTLEEEAIDRALRDRVRDDPYLRRATDILLGLRALVR